MFCEPNNAGLCSTPAAVGRRVAKIIDALSTLGWCVSRGPGSIDSFLDDARLQIFYRLRAEGWRIKVGNNDRYRVLPPNPERMTEEERQSMRDARAVCHSQGWAFGQQPESEG